MKSVLASLKILLLSIITTLSLSIFAETDLSIEFKKILDQKLDLTLDEQSFLRNYDVYFIPGILAESLISADPDSTINVSLITQDYFGTQIDLLNNKYKIPTKRIKTSSYDVSITRKNIREAVASSKLKKRKVILLSHSLGGLALVEELVLNPEIQNQIAGIIFLQSPFYGTPVGEIMLKSPNLINLLIKVTLPFVNISDRTLFYVGYEAREIYMKKNEEAIKNFIKKIPAYTFSGVADGNKSLFKPLIDIMESGCLKGITNNCMTDKFYPGPYDKNDGLIPLKSARLVNADFVSIKDVDHAEIILRVPFEDFSKEHLTTTWLRILMKKMTTTSKPKPKAL